MKKRYIQMIMKENNQRIENLKKKLFNNYDSSMFFERMILLEEAFKKYKYLPKEIIYSKIFYYIISNMSVSIDKNELIVGNIKEIVPNMEQEKLFIEKANENNFSAIQLFSFDPLGIIDIKDVGPRYAPTWFNSWGHLTPSWEKLLNKGYRGIQEDAKKYLNTIKSKDNIKKLHYYESIINCSQAMILLSNRYALIADNIAKKETIKARKKELETISKICKRVPAQPAQSFWEALQSIWLTTMVLHCICGARDYGLGRFDQYMYQYYRNDINHGVIHKGDALELLKCFFIKINEIIGMGVETNKPKRILSVNSLQYLILGGMDKYGADSSNELSHLILEAIDYLKLKQPTVMVRYNKNINKTLFIKSVNIAKQGLGYPAFYNDDIVIKALINAGVDKNDAVDYVHYGCLNPNIPGKEDELREVWHNLPKYLEFAINEGDCITTGKNVGLKKPKYSIKKIKDINTLLEAFRYQVKAGIQKAIVKMNTNDELWANLKPFSFESLLIDYCVERGEDCTGKGVFYKHMNHHAVGIATVVNSIYAIKKMVYDDQLITLLNLRNILREDYEGYEQLREYIVNKIPKYGNDVSEVDEIAYKVGKIFCTEVMKMSTKGGRKSWPSFYSLWHHREMGKYTGATADGRLAGEPLSENQSPVYNTEKEGPTALLNSISTLPFHITPGGGLNIKFQPSFLEGDKGNVLLMSLIEGYFLKGGLEIQMNVIDRETLLEAKKYPEKHSNLLVRVVGYSAYFVTLSSEQQDELIARTSL